MSKIEEVKLFLIDKEYLNITHDKKEFYESMAECVRDEMLDEDILVNALAKQIRRDYDNTGV